jgi:DNA repair photolyase
VFVRWEGQATEREAERRLPGMTAGGVVRTFDAPEAMGVRFHEVEAKSALNRVPGEALPFAWTVNPYRGCSHACTYCLDGGTPILMGDGRTKPLAELRVGDTIYGTRPEGRYRRYVLTEVRDHWATRKEAYKVVLRDGTELTASGDHRFLSDRGWSHVRPSESEPARPHLERGDRLAGMRGDWGESQPLVDEVPTRPAFDVMSIDPVGERDLFDITTGTGDFIADGVVSHNCFARPTHRYLDLNAREDFEREIVVKVNVPERLRAELARPSWKGEMVALGTNTDPYQWVEGRYGLTRAIWEVMIEARNPASVLTKSPLLTRDIDLFRELHDVAGFQASLSIPTLDEAAWRATEPRTPHPRKRIEAVAELSDAGIPVGILIAPLMPGINDSPEQVERILELLAEAGVDSVGGIGLHLKGEVREIFLDWLRSQRPDLVDRYEELYAGGAFLPSAERKRIEGLISRARRRSEVGASDWRERVKRERERRREVVRLTRRRAGRAVRPQAEEEPVSRQEPLF